MIGNFLSLNLEIRPINEAIISIDNIEYSYGFGVYETLKVRNNVLFFPENHISRLLNSASIIDLKHEFENTKILCSLKELIKKNNLDISNIKIILVGSRNPKDSLLYMFATNPLFPEKRFYSEGIKLITYEGERLFPQAKTLSMLTSYMAYNKAKENNAYDALLVDNKGFVREGTRTNFFFTDGTKIFTPPKNKVLDGVTRQKVIEVTNLNKTEIEEKEIHIDELNSYKGFFITSTSSNIIPVSRINNLFFTIPQIINDLMKMYNDYLKLYLKSNLN